MITLPKSSRFFPLAHGRYEVSAGLKPLGTDYGNGVTDARTFLFDENYSEYRQTKLRARQERLTKYYPPSSELDSVTQRGVARSIAETLAREWPEFFTLTSTPEGFHLHSKLTDESFTFDGEFALSGSMGSPVGAPPYRDGIDALASLLQEDISIWKRAPDNREWLASIHLCFPNHWKAEDKIGQPFNSVHTPVAGFQKLAKAAPGLVEMMITKGPFVRFAWGVATDRELNHHPENPLQGRKFNSASPELQLRIERQTLTPFPQWSASLFTIRTYFLDCARDLSESELRALQAAIRSMTPESLQYKGLTETHPEILSWLDSLVSHS